MNRLEGVIATLDYLMSASLLFAGLEFTVIILKPEDVEEENNNEHEHGFIE